MTAADYAHDQRSGNSQGLHYSTFEPPSKKRAHARSTSCSKKIFPRCANPPSWANDPNSWLASRVDCNRRAMAGFDAAQAAWSRGFLCCHRIHIEHHINAPGAALLCNEPVHQPFLPSAIFSVQDRASSCVLHAHIRDARLDKANVRDDDLKNRVPIRWDAIGAVALEQRPVKRLDCFASSGDHPSRMDEICA